MGAEPGSVAETRIVTKMTSHGTAAGNTPKM